MDINTKGTPMDAFMKDKVALVTGAAQGIGLAAARAFAQAGATVVLSDIHEPVKQAKELEAQGFRAMSIQCDVADEKQVQTMIGKSFPLSVNWMPPTTMRVSTVRSPRQPMPAARNTTVS